MDDASAGLASSAALAGLDTFTGGFASGADMLSGGALSGGLSGLLGGGGSSAPRPDPTAWMDRPAPTISVGGVIVRSGGTIRNPVSIPSIIPATQTYFYGMTALPDGRYQAPSGAVYAADPSTGNLVREFSAGGFPWLAVGGGLAGLLVLFLVLRR